jgi:hypothetical protein
MEYDQRVIIRFLCKKGVSPEGIHAPFEAQSETLLTASGASGRGARIFGKDVKICMTRCDSAGHQLTC